MEKFSVSRLLGAPPGYVGYEEGGYLTEKVRRRPYSVVLFDEIEKAHPDVFNMLLQVLDDGRLTDSVGHVVDFKNTILIMTSNLGTSFIGKRTSPGFLAEGDDASHDRMKDKVLEELKRAFRPEFINRIDDIIVFHSLSKEDITAIVRMMVARINPQLADKSIRIEPTEAALDLLVQKGFDATYGARQLRRTHPEARRGSARRGDRPRAVRRRRADRGRRRRGELRLPGDRDGGASARAGGALTAVRRAQAQGSAHFVSAGRAFSLHFFCPPALAGGRRRRSASAPPGAGEPAPIIIKDIAVQGNRRVQEAVILGRVTAKVGAPFQPSRLAEDIRAIFALGFFDDVQLKVEDFEGGVKVIFVVVERPFVRDIVFSGNKKLDTATLTRRRSTSSWAASTIPSRSTAPPRSSRSATSRRATSRSW